MKVNFLEDGMGQVSIFQTSAQFWLVETVIYMGGYQKASVVERDVNNCLKAVIDLMDTI